MKITIDTDLLQNEYNLSLEEFLILILLNSDFDINELFNNLEAKNYIRIENNKGIIPIETSNMIKDFIILNNDKVKYKLNKYIELARKLKELYPKGKKPGTNYMWRDSDAVIAKKLMTLVVKYNFEFTDEQAINATKKYVSSFNGDYTYMQLLKYFLLKTASDADGNAVIKSEFMSLIENEDQENENNVNWTDELV